MKRVRANVQSASRCYLISTSGVKCWKNEDYKNIYSKNR